MDGLSPCRAVGCRSYNEMEFTWDDVKRRANLSKHGLDFADAEIVFRVYTISAEDAREAYGEQRLQTLGLLRETMVMVTHTERRGSIRIISLRKATQHETENFFESLAN